jgi:hypothetical protein
LATLNNSARLSAVGKILGMGLVGIDGGSVAIGKLRAQASMVRFADNATWPSGKFAMPYAVVAFAQSRSHNAARETDIPVAA